MDANHFSDFDTFPFDAIPEDDTLMLLAGQQPGPMNNATLQTFQGSTPIPNAPFNHVTPAAMSGGSTGRENAQAASTTSFDRAEEDGVGSVGNERQTPGSNVVDDVFAEDRSDSHRERADGTDLGKSRDDKSDLTPAWSELKTKAGKERKRLPLACIACRRKKIRCSGEKPSCKHCMRSRVPCVYKVTTRKAAPRTDYMAMLDKRLKRMEERIIKVIPKSEQGATASVPRAILKPSVTGNSSASKGPSRKRNNEEAFGGLQAFLKTTPNSQQVEAEKENALKIKDDEESHLFQEGAGALPSKEVQEHLAEVFFDNVYGQAYNLLHKPSYMHKLKNNHLPPVLVLSVCAIAARFATKTDVHQDNRKFLEGEEWARHARAICVRRYEWPNITILTCLLILGLHEFGTCQGGRSWALGGLAIRMAFALQLHKELDYDPSIRGNKAPLSFIDREIRRRIMWACFLMDRFNSSGVDRPMMIREETIQTCLPVTERNFQLDMPVPTETLDGKVHPSALLKDGKQPDLRENMGVAAYLTRSVALWARIITYLNQGGRDADAHPLWDSRSGFSALCKDAENFQARMPPILRYTTDNLSVHDTENTAKQYLLMHITIQQNLLYLYRSALASYKQGENGPPDDFLNESKAKTYDAAHRISTLLDAAEGSQQFISAPFAGYCTFTATMTWVTGIRSGDPMATMQQMSSDVEINIRYLNKMSKYWGMFYWMVEHVRSEYRAALDAARSGKTGQGHVVPHLLQYGDWFNEYPHGLAATDGSDPSNNKKKEKGADGVMEPKSELQSVQEFFTTLSPHGQDKGDKQRGQGAAKRKQAGRRQSTTTVRSGQGQSVTALAESNSHRVASQVSAQLQQQQQRRFSEQHQMAHQNPAVAFNTMAAAQSQPGMFNISPISPVAMQNQFSQNPGPGRTGFFPSEMMVVQQSNPLLQSMEQQMLLEDFSMDAGGIVPGQGMAEGNPNWGDLQLDSARLQQQRNLKRHPSGGQPQGQSNADLGNFQHQQDTSWFMPFNMQPPVPNADIGMDATSLDAFGGLFNGSNNNDNPSSNNGGNAGHGLPNSTSLGGLRQGQ